MDNTDDFGVSQLLNEIAENSPTEGYFTSAQMDKGVRELRRESGVDESDSPEVAAEKMRAEVEEQYGPAARYEWHPDVIAEAKRRQQSFQELSTAIRRGQMNRSEAAITWEARHGTPESLRRVQAEEANRLLTARPPSRTLQDIEAERRIQDQEVQKALGRDPGYGALCSIEWMLKEIKAGR